MPPSGKSSRGRGGGSKSNRSISGKRDSSHSSNPVGSTANSPPSVTKNRPPQAEASPGAQCSASGSQHHQPPPKRPRPEIPVTQPQPQPSQQTHRQPSQQPHRQPSQQPHRQPSQQQVTQPTPSHPSITHPTANQLAFTLPNQQNLHHDDQEHDDEDEEEEAYEEQDVPDNEPLHPPPNQEELERSREAQMTLAELLVKEGRERMTRLSPTGTGIWFTRNKSVLTKKISKILKSQFKGAWYSWSVTPIDVQDRYFIELANRFNWDPVDTPQVREGFNAICQQRLKGLISYVRRKRRRPSWISETLYEKMDDYWNSADAMEKSEKASNSRNSPRDGLGPHIHVGGPKSHAEIKFDMEKELGRPVSYGEVFMKTHTRKDGTYVDRKAQLVGEAYKRNLHVKLLEVNPEAAAALNSEDDASLIPLLTTDQMDEVFLKSTYEDDRGIHYGISGLENGRSSGDEAASCSSSSSTITHLEQQLKEAQLKIAEQAALNQQRELEAQQHKQQMEYLLTCMKRIAPDLPEWNANPVQPQIQLDGEGNPLTEPSTNNP